MKAYGSKRLPVPVELLSIAVDQMSAGVAITDMAGNVLYANRVLAEMHQFSAAELIGKSFSVFYAPEHQPAFLEAYSQVCENGVFQVEILHHRRDGSSFPALLQQSVLKNLADKPIGILWAVTEAHQPVRRLRPPVRKAAGNPSGHIGFKGGPEKDPGESERMQAVVRESEDKLLTSLNGILAGVVIVQEERVAYLNPRAVEIMGYEHPVEVLGRIFWDLVHPDDRALVRDRGLRRAAGEHPPSRYEFRFLRRDGTVRQVEIKSSATIYRGRVALIGNFLDVTDTRLAQRALQHELEVNTALAGVAAALMGSTHDIGRIAALVLEQAKRLTGSEHGYVSAIDPATGENVGYTLTEMAPGQCSIPGRRIAFAPEPDGRYPGLWGHALTTGKPFYTNDPGRHFSARGLPQGHIPLERFLSVPVLVDGAPAGQIALANPRKAYIDQDLRAIERLGDLYAIALQRNQMEQERETLRERLTSAQKLEAIGTLARGIAHDFNNILGAILGHAQMISERREEISAGAEHAAQIIQACLRAKDVVKQILSFSRDGEGEKCAIDLSPILEEALKLVRSSFPASIEVRYHLPRDVGMVMADPAQIHQVAMNLFANARDAMEGSGGVLEVGLAPATQDQQSFIEFPDLPPGRYLKLVVSDTGHGMDPATRARIFEPYFSTKDAAKGTGLGLAVVHGIVKKYGGAISVSSAPGCGTTFRIMLPVVPSEPRKEIPPPAEAPRGCGRVLFVDDEQALADLAERMFAYLGYQAVVHTDPMEALEAFRTDPSGFDVVVTDLTMPHMTGDRLAREICAIRPGMPVVICTGYSYTAITDDLKTIGVDELLIKPLTLADLGAGIQRAVKRPA